MTGMDQDRFVVSDAVWMKVASLLPGKATDPGATGKDNRLFLEAVLWRVRTRSPWRDLPRGFGNWNSVFQRFRRWVRAGVFERLFERVSDEPDFEYALIDGTIVSAHQKASGAKGGLRIRPSAARAAGWPPRSSPWSTRSATWCASSCCRGNGTTALAWRRSSAASLLAPCSATRPSTSIGCGPNSTPAEPPPSSRPRPTARLPFPATGRCTDGGT